MEQKHFFRDGLPYIVPGIIILIILGSTYFFAQQQRKLFKQDAILKVANKIDLLGANLQDAINRRLHLLDGLVAFQKSHSTFSQEEFLKFGYALEGNQKGILALELIPNGVITYVTHPEKNKAVMGYNILNHPVYAAPLRESIAKRDYALVGPRELLQGGTAIIAIFPIFTPSNQNEKEAFWGLASVLIDFNTFMKEINIEQWRQDLRIAIRGKNGKGAKGEVFFGPKEIFNQDPKITSVTLISGSWQIAALPKQGWPTSWPNAKIFWLIALLTTTLVGILTFLILQHPKRLQQAVNKATTDLKEREAQLRQAQKLEAIGQLSGGVAHDFNNLLAVIMGNAELIKSDSNKIKKLVQNIIYATNQGSQLTNRLLAYARQQPLEAKTISLKQIMTDLKDLLSRTLGENIEVSFQIDKDLWVVKIDPNQFETAILNLVINARDAMPDGGKLTIECQNQHIGKKALSFTPDLKTGDYVVLTVKDNGVGMPDHILSRAFEPFFTTKEVDEGSGLGLSTVYGFAKQSGGQINIKSKQNKGTTITLFLPREKQNPADSGERLETKAPLGNQEQILVIEDNFFVRNVTKEILKSLNYTVQSATNTNEARNILQEKNNVQLILSDIILPGKESGPKFAEYTQQHYPNIKIIFMSGYTTNSQTLDKFLKQGHILITKPFTRAKLAVELYEVLNNK